MKNTVIIIEIAAYIFHQNSLQLFPAIKSPVTNKISIVTGANAKTP